MTATAQLVSLDALPLYRVRDAKLDWKVIAQLCACVVPAMGILSLQRPALGARYIVLLLFVILGYHFLKGNHHEYLALVVGSLPALGLLRGLFFYYSITMFLMGGIALWAVVATREVLFVWRDLTWKVFVFLLIVYWWISIANTHDYSGYMRILELSFTSTAVYLLASRRSSLATGLVGFGISGTLVALSLLHYGGARLGVADIGGIDIGNPILVGVPSALVMLFTVADRGRWLLLENHPIWRMILATFAAVWMLLSGSRGGWLVGGCGAIILLLFSKLSRKSLFILVVVTTLLATVLLSSSRGAKVVEVFDKTVDSSRSLANRTSFRSVQWTAIPKVFWASPIWGWGPGSGRNVAWLYTGRHLAWHALYLQVIGETGLLGAIGLFSILGSLIYRSILHTRRLGEMLPLIGVVSYMTIGLSVSGFDAFSGVCLGLAFMARESTSRFTIREAWVEFSYTETLQSTPVLPR